MRRLSSALWLLTLAASVHALGLGASPARLEVELPFGGEREVGLLLTNAGEPLEIAFEFEGGNLSAALPPPFMMADHERRRVLLTLATPLRQPANVSGLLRVRGRAGATAGPGLEVPVRAVVGPPRMQAVLASASVFPVEVGSPLILEAAVLNSGTAAVAVRVRLEVNGSAFETAEIALRPGRRWADRLFFAHGLEAGAHEGRVELRTGTETIESRAIAVTVHRAQSQNRSLRAGPSRLVREGGSLTASVEVENPSPFVARAALDSALLDEGFPVAKAQSANETISPFSNASLRAVFMSPPAGRLVLTGMVVSGAQRVPVPPLPVTVREPVHPVILGGAIGAGLAAGIVFMRWRRRKLVILKPENPASPEGAEWEP